MTTPYTRRTRGSSEKCRRIVLEAHGFTNSLGRLCLKCVDCGLILEVYRDQNWDADHIRTVAEGGEDTPANLVCRCDACHDTKTHTQDIPRIAKGKQQRDKHHGVRRSGGGFRSAPAGYVYDWKLRRYVKPED